MRIVALISSEGIRLMELTELIPIVKVPIVKPLSTQWVPQQHYSYRRPEYREFLLQDAHTYIELESQ